jgi:hypothetical protein
MYDVKNATYACYMLKIQKASNRNAFSTDGQSFHPEQMVANLWRLAARYAPIGFM